MYMYMYMYMCVYIYIYIHTYMHEVQTDRSGDAERVLAGTDRPGQKYSIV